ncbi:transglycosylase SLT domain-containing protein [Aquincola sp. MAHUQ-54]|uniref:Transglycosylase SLT domain-containing protein n=1 Tax=Aquincola agrisoli TaxID=3119538 RepID=A0AAW9Q888_9BURK
MQKPRPLASLIGLATALLLTTQAPLVRAQGADGLVLEAREAQRKKDRVRLVALRDAAQATRHPLASWVDYWELGSRLNTAQQDELEAFYARWPGSYVEDRLRNDWLLELGKRRDWANFSRDFPRFRMNDDRQVTCYALLTAHLDGQQVRDAALPAWLAQRDLDDGCALMAATLYEAKVFTKDDVWRRIRQAAEGNKPAAARSAAALVSPQLAAAVAEAFAQPAKPLGRKAVVMTHDTAEVTAVALARMAADDPDNATALLRARWARLLPQAPAGWAWSQVGRSHAQKLQADAVTAYAEAFAQREQKPHASDSQWTDDTLAWAVRSALRFPAAERWAIVARAIDEMSAEEQADAGWQYWKGRALRETAPQGPRGDEQRREAETVLQAIASPLHFYGQLATEDLGRSLALPPAPAPLTAQERAAARANPGLQRALQLIGLGLRSEGVREWNFTLRGMADRELLAAAQWACEREVWDRCINTSDRTRNEIDLEQRYPMPLRRHVVEQAGSIGLDPAYVYGLIRQESRFIMDARSHVGASGLMQIMPATARWTAKKIGLDYSADMINDRDTNLRLGTAYLKLALDDFGGSQAMAAAAYNAGPGRPRRWREGATVEAAAWAENIPFSETRDYVKKVLGNATVYSALITGKPPALKPRLGGPIGPRSPITNDRDLP